MTGPGETVGAADLRERISSPDGAQVIAFYLGGVPHACDVLMIQEVVTKRKVHPLPDMPPRLLGVLRLRGELVPVLDVAPLLDMSLDDAPQRTILIVESEVGWVGVATDGVHEVLHLSAGSYRPSPLTGRERDSYVIGVARVDGMLLTLIDLAEMLREQTTYARGETS
jgi:purine-binding chemotaxis protein CheW